MPEAPRKISFASGKGGVGKTLLAANFARLCSTRRRCLLLDLDFQNQGASGLLSSYLEPGCANAFDLLSGTVIEPARIVKIRQQLDFVPSFDPVKKDRFLLQTNPMFSSLGLEELHNGLAALLDLYDLVIIDCHGGLDDLSFSAFIEADCTVIVTEADKVTFNGTLELVDYYWDRSQEQTSVSSTAIDQTTREKLVNITSNHTRVIINRVTGKYDYDLLLKVIESELYENFPDLKAMNAGFDFIPSDPLLSESFSEHPFFVEILPESIFTQKLELTHRELFSESPTVSGRSRFYRLFERVGERRLRRRLTSAYDDRVKTVFTFTAAMQLLIFISMIVAIIGTIIQSLGLDLSARLEKINSWYLGVGGISIGEIFLAYLIVFQIRISGFYRDRWRYEVRLWRMGARRRTLTFVMRMTTILGVRIATALFAGVSVLYGILFIVIAADQGFP